MGRAGYKRSPPAALIAAVAFGLWFVETWELSGHPDRLAKCRPGKPVFRELGFPVRSSHQVQECASHEAGAARSVSPGAAWPLWGAPRRALEVSRGAGGTRGSPLSLPRASRCLGSTAGAYAGQGLRFHSPRFLCGTSSCVHAGAFPEMAKGEPAVGSCKTLISLAARNPAGPARHFSGTSSWKQADIFF